jgi:hypothetical protein
MIRFLAIYHLAGEDLKRRMIVEAKSHSAAGASIFSMPELKTMATLFELRPLEETDFLAIRFWGKNMRSFEYYICNEQTLAFNTRAPLDAIFPRKEPEFGVVTEWATIAGTENPVIAPAYANYLKEQGYAS